MARRPPASTKARAVALLARRDHGRAELFRKLVDKGLPRDEVEVALDQLEDVGLLDDDRAARSLARGMVRNRGYGPRKVENNLIQQRRFSRELAKRTLEELEVDWTAMACALAEKRRVDFEDRKSRDRLLRWLAGRGFAAGDCYTALDHLREREE